MCAMIFAVLFATLTRVAGENSGDMMVGIHYPKALFDEKNHWKYSIHYDDNLAALSANNKTYVDIAQASDQNDIYAYENWFYGKQ